MFGKQLFHRFLKNECSSEILRLRIPILRFGDDGKAPQENELKNRVNFLVRRMPTMQKKVFEMSRFEEKSHREIAHALSISIKTVEVHITRALKFLRQNLNIFGLLAILSFIS